MWAVALHSEKSYQEMLKAFAGEVEYKLVTTATGGSVAEAPRGSKYPHLFLVSENLQQTKHVLSWLHTNLHPQIIVSSDVTPDCGPADQDESSHFVPHACLRSAGRTDLGGAPVLYEELHFDSSLQTQILAALDLKSVDSQHLLFGSTKTKHRSEECQWLFRHLKCRSWDAYSAELLLAGKRLGVKIGCFKVFDREGDEKARLGLLVAGWRRIVELL